MNHTEHYGLNLYEGSDYIHHDNFNADNQRIEAALDALPKLQIGSYTGSGTYGADHPTTLTFPFAPKVVILESYGRNYAPAFLWPGADQVTVCLHIADDSNFIVNRSNTVRWSEDGKTVSFYNFDGADWQLNSNRSTYGYIAIG